MADENGAAPEAVAEAAPVEPSRTDAIVDRWFVDLIHNSVASRDTQIVNHLMAAKEELKRRLGKE